MIHKTAAVVLHQVKYSETSIIVTLYTKSNGRQSYIVNGIRSPKSKQKMGLLQPLFLLDIEAYYKQGREIQRLKEFRLAEVYTTIPFDIVKSTMAMFMAEILYKVLYSEEADEELFEFVVHSLQYFDSIEKGAANFHLWFLIQVLRHLGFSLENNHSIHQPWFDMKNGTFVPLRPVFPNTPSLDESEIISTLLSINVGSLDSLLLNGAQRSRLLEVITEYYTIHFDGIGTINSLRVLNEIFH